MNFAKKKIMKSIEWWTFFKRILGLFIQVKLSFAEDWIKNKNKNTTVSAL